MTVDQCIAMEEDLYRAMLSKCCWNNSVANIFHSSVKVKAACLFIYIIMGKFLRKHDQISHIRPN